jgi:endonuclease/exonuclease/phosphatase (EEP) superfamily protein YafD
MTWGRTGRTRTVTLFATHVLAPWPKPASRWTRELAQLNALLDAQPGTTVDAGDFNASLDDGPFRFLLRKGFHDGATLSGDGLQPTYPSNSLLPPLITIDHVLVRHATASSSRTFRVAGTDHRALLEQLWV